VCQKGRPFLTQKSAKGDIPFYYRNIILNRGVPFGLKMCQKGASLLTQKKGEKVERYKDRK
jgi:hypothetical protein